MTDTVIATILRAVEVGLPVIRAAHAAGVGENAVKQHMRRHPEFVTELEKATAVAQHRLVTRIQEAADRQWQAAAWILERRWPEEWARRDIDVNKSLQEMAQQLRTFMSEARKQDTAEGEETDPGGQGSGS